MPIADLLALLFLYMTTPYLGYLSNIRQRFINFPSDVYRTLALALAKASEIFTLVINPAPRKIC